MGNRGPDNGGWSKWIFGSMIVFGSLGTYYVSHMAGRNERSLEKAENWLIGGQIIEVVQYLQ